MSQDHRRLMGSPFDRATRLMFTRILAGLLLAMPIWLGNSDTTPGKYWKYLFIPFFGR